MGYQPTIPSLVTELSVYLVFFLACCNALGQGRRWLCTVLGGAVGGFFAEVLITRLPDPRYFYTTDLFILHWQGVPLLIGFGWGMIFYAATWTAQRLGLGLVGSSLVAGTLGVNLDLSLDPMAHHHRFWVWQPRTDPFPNADLFGVPFDNFIAWVALIGFYGLSVRYAFRLVDRRERKHADAKVAAAATEAAEPPPSLEPVPGAASLERHGNLWLDVLVPPLAALIAGGVFGLIRNRADEVYHWVGRTNVAAGEALVFFAIFSVGIFAFLRHVRAAGRSEEPNWVVIGIAAYIHLLSLFLFIWEVFAGDIHDIAAMGFMIPMNLLAALIGFAWPSLDTLTARFADRGLNPGLPGVALRTLSTYSGNKLRAYVWSPANAAELEGVLAYARSLGKRVTFRAGGQSFDSQSLNDQMVISLERFTDVKIDEKARTVTVGAGATWGNILTQTLEVGLVPYVMVTNSIATAGGTLSANCLARFSATVGREGTYVDSFLLYTPDGKSWRCSRSENPKLFHAVIGGLGYVGAVLEITYRLLHVGVGAVVKTTFTRVKGLDKIRDALKKAEAPATRFGSLVDALSSRTQESVGRCKDAQPVTTTPEAVSAVVYMRGGAWGLIARSQYVPYTKPRPSVFHSPASLRHLLLQLLAAIPLLRRIGYFITFRLGYEDTTVNYDKPFGYTFFEDGNRKLRRMLKRIGLPCRIVQQTYFLPTSIGAGGVDSGALSAFLTEADAHLDQARLEPALIDVLYIGADQDEFLLSSSNGFEGFAVTFTFERLWFAMKREAEALTVVSQICRRHAGRVHLVKNVHADRALIHEMYGPRIEALKALRDPNQAQHLFNDFSKRVLPGIS